VISYLPPFINNRS